MTSSNKYGLIGESLSHSFSKEFFEKKFRALKLDHTYDLIEIPDVSSLQSWIKTKELNGFNVTIPYKESILPLLDSLDDTAKKIGAVNTVVLQENGYKGFNTDVYGFKSLLSELPGNIDGALILGTGGASKAVQYVLSEMGMLFLAVSRNPTDNHEMPYGELNELNFSQFNTIVNCTPLGMHPNVDSFPDIPYQNLSSKHMLIDLVYNPLETSFMKHGTERGCYVTNGLKMLHEQAEQSWHLWNN